MARLEATDHGQQQCEQGLVGFAPPAQREREAGMKVLGGQPCGDEAPWPEAAPCPECQGPPATDARSGKGLAVEKAEAAAGHTGSPWTLEVGPHFWNSCAECF